MSNQKLLTIFVLILIAVFAGGYLLWSLSFNAMLNNMSAHMDFDEMGEYMDSDHMTMSEKRDNFLALRYDITHKNMEHGDYACCLEKPCTYCIEKTPGHGEGSTCSCLDDVMNGRHPCGECIGEILEGHGNRFLKEYFAPAIAEEVGMEHLATLERIIEQKYSSNVE